jgi:hypothetical protein
MGLLGVQPLAMAATLSPSYQNVRPQIFCEANPAEIFEPLARYC